MLSRVAESLYWAARYVERAEDVTRLLDVEYHALLDAHVADHGEAWHQLVALLGDDESSPSTSTRSRAQNVAEWLLWHDGNPNAVASCITAARENARSVREQISGEMWEAINSLFLLVGRANRRTTVRGPHAFFEQLRNGAHRFQGVRGRDDDPRRAVRVHPARPPPRAGIRRLRAWSAADTRWRSRSRDDDPAQAHELIALLKSCSAFEAYVSATGRRSSRSTSPNRSSAREQFPRSVLYCLRTCATSVDRIAGEQGAPHSVLGRICAEIEYGEVDDVSGRGVPRRWAGSSAGSTGRRRVDEGVLLEPHAPGVGGRDPGGTAAAMWLSVEHVTRFAYDAPITEAYTELRLKPAHLDGQRCSSFSLVPEPRGVSVARVRRPIREHRPPLRRPRAARAHHRDRPQRGLDGARFVDGTPLSPLDRFDFLAASRYVPLDDRLELAAARASGEPAQTATS